MKQKAVFLLVGMALVLSVVSPASAKTNVEFIFDCSKSMNDRVSGERKIDLAKAAFNKMIDEWQPGEEGQTNIGLRFYGFEFDRNKSREANCLISELIVPMQGVDKTLLKRKVSGVEAKGMTPIAYSLQQAARDFQGRDGENNAIILISDGKESCGGDPVAAAKMLQDAGFRTITHVVGFGVSAEEEKQLKEIASAGGGSYYKAEDAAQLSDSLKEAVKQVDRGKKEFQLPDAEGEKVDPGNNMESAPLIKPGKYTGDLYTKEKLFYKISMDKEQVLNIKVQLRQPKDRPSGFFGTTSCIFYTGDYEVMHKEQFESPSDTPFTKRIAFQIPEAVAATCASWPMEVYICLQGSALSEKKKIDYSLDINMQ